MSPPILAKAPTLQVCSNLLAARYAGRGVNLVQRGGKWAFRTAEDLGFLLRREETRDRQLSRAALETLSIIAYHQPATRAEVEEVRGVETGKGTLDLLMEAGWVRMRGRRRTPGRPVTYGTTEAFLDHFGLESLGDLPGLEELKGAGLLSSRLPPSHADPAALRWSPARGRRPARSRRHRRAERRRRMSAESEFPAWGPRGTAGVSFAAALNFEAVRVSLGGRPVLNEFSLALSPGEIVCLLGESGSGKSTILRVAAGIQPIDGGTVRINGEIVSSASIRRPPDKRGIGLMFQDFALFPHLSLLHNVTFGLRRLGRTAALAQARAALKRVGLDEREADYPHMLSGGQQQRLALARTIAPRPGILMLDEPFSSLDARLRETVRGETLAILRETNATTIIVTHDPEEAMLLGDRIALLRKGSIAQIDTAAAIYRDPIDLSAARFFSPLSEIAAVVKDGYADTPFGRVAAPGRAAGDRVVVAIRPVGVLEMAKDGEGVPGRIVSKRDAIGIDLCEVQVDRPRPSGRNCGSAPMRILRPAMTCS